MHISPYQVHILYMYFHETLNFGSRGARNTNNLSAFNSATASDCDSKLCIEQNINGFKLAQSDRLPLSQQLLLFSTRWALH
jgi:hypothetical protein